MDRSDTEFWCVSPERALELLAAGPEGLTDDEARTRLERYGANTLKPPGRSDALTLLLAQFKNPIVLTLIAASALSLFLHDSTDAVIIAIIVLVSGLLGFWQEKGASDAVEKLLAIVKIRATVRRGGKPKDIPIEEVVSGDIIILNAGDAIPADALILESKDLFMDEATLTGETYPVEKMRAHCPSRLRSADEPTVCSWAPM